jgi:hypothetical protein
LAIHITTRKLLKELTTSIKENEDEREKEPDESHKTDKRKSNGGRRKGDVKRQKLTSNKYASF